MRHSLRAAALGLVFVTACASPTRHDAPVDESASPIVGGTVDTTRAAVVAVLGTDFACSGTIVAASAGQGTVLTAARCCAADDPPSEIVIGNDYSSGQAVLIAPGSIWAESIFDPMTPDVATDLCLLQVPGASLPTIPLSAAPDGVGVGSVAAVVGYGITANPPNGTNSKRRQASLTVDAVTATTIHWSQPDAGACEGDHGGPVLFTSGSGEAVVGVVSASDAVTCVPGGETANRVSAQLGDTGFIGAYFAGHPFGRHALADGGLEIVDAPDAGADAGSTGGRSDGGAGNDSGTSGGADGGASTTRSDGGASSNAGGNDDGGGCSTSGEKDDASTGALLGFAIGAAFIAKRRRAKR